MASVNKHRGRYRAVYKDASGRWREKAVPKGMKKEAAKQFANALETRETQIREGLAVAPSAETLLEASVRYLRSIRNTRGHATVEGLWRCRVLPVLGAGRASQLRPTQVDEFLEGLKEEGYADNTRLRIRSTLSACYEWLIRDGVVASNPVRTAKRIRASKGKPQVLTYSQVMALADAAAYPGLRYAILLAYYTACRPGELLGATWAEVDLDRGELQVERSMRGATTTKTGRSRAVSLPPPAVALLTRMRAEALARSKAGHLSGEPLFLNSEGRPMERRSFARTLATALVAAGLVLGWETVCCHGGCRYVGQGKPEPGAQCPKCSRRNLRARGLPIRFSPKGFRSSSITQIVESGGSIKAAAEQAGHSRTGTTEGHYLEVSKPYVAEAVRKAFPGTELAPVVPLRARELAAIRWKVESVIAEVKR